MIEVVIGEQPLKAAMIRYGLDILGLSILISIITAALVYLSLDALLVKPMTKLTWNIVRFSERPEDPTRVITPSGRRDEIGTAERELASMQKELAETLSQRNRLAALGLAVSKISHDLRNMLSSAQLLSDRLITVKDPTVQRLVPKLIASLDRAIRLCARTLDFGQAHEMPPRRKRFALAPLIAEIGDSLGLPRQKSRLDRRRRAGARGRRRPRPALSGVEQSLPQRGAGAGERQRGRAARSSSPRGARARSPSSKCPTPAPACRSGRARICSRRSRACRAKAGRASASPSPHELVQAHGGQIALVKNDGGATFRVSIPDVVVELERARQRRA